MYGRHVAPGSAPKISTFMATWFVCAMEPARQSRTNQYPIKSPASPALIKLHLHYSHTFSIQHLPQTYVQQLFLRAFCFLLDYQNGMFFTRFQPKNTTENSDE